MEQRKAENLQANRKAMNYERKKNEERLILKVTDVFAVSLSCNQRRKNNGSCKSVSK